MIWGIACLVVSGAIWNFSRTAHWSPQRKAAAPPTVLFLGVLGFLLLFGSFFEDPADQAKQLFHLIWVFGLFAVLILALSFLVDAKEGIDNRRYKKHKQDG